MLGGHQSMLPVSHRGRSSLIRSQAKLSGRESALVALILLFGGLWSIAVFRTTGTHHSSLPSSQPIERSQGDFELDAKRVSDGGQATRVLARNNLYDESQDSPGEIADPSHLVHTLQELGSEARSQVGRQGSQDSFITTQGAQAKPEAPSWNIPAEPKEPASVPELIEDVRLNGQPSLRRHRSTDGMLLYPVVVEHNLSTPAFTRWYAQEYGPQPVKILGSQDDWFKAEDWTLEAVTEVVGDTSLYRSISRCKVGAKERQSGHCHRVKQKDPAMVGRSWAAMVSVNLDQRGMATYSDLFDRQIELAKHGEYLYAQEVGPRWVLELVKRLKQPKYFLNNINDVITDNKPDPHKEMAKDVFPAFFFGPAGSQSPLHTDTKMTRFWILELAGTKLIRLIPPSNNWRADATDQGDFQPELFTADIMVPDYTAHPNLRGMLVYETILQPGDLLYIPEGWAHQALNLEWTCMASFNYNDENNLQNRLSLYHYDLPETERRVEMSARQFFLPLVNMSRDLGNVEVVEYFRSNCLEYAKVSDAARAHIQKLKDLDVDPEDWMDLYSTPVLQVALTHNYVALARWLVEEQGVPLRNDTAGQDWLRYVEEEAGFKAMAKWMRQYMGLDR